MNVLIITVVLVVIFLLVFVMFSLDDHEEEEGFLSDETARTSDAEEKASKLNETIETSPTVISPPAETVLKAETFEQAPSSEVFFPTEETMSSVVETPSEPVTIAPAEIAKPIEAVTSVAATVPAPKNEPNIVLPERLKSENFGSEDDLSFRVNIHEKLPVACNIKKFDCVAAVVQIRLPESLSETPDKFLRMLQRAESVIESEYSFPFSAHNLNQLSKLYLFSSDDNAKVSDPLFEALVVAFEVISKFKYALRTDTILSESKVKISVGISMGSAIQVDHGIANPPTWYGKPIYLAEALAESALDLKIHVDKLIHDEALPLFDFREWKPVVLRPSMPAMQMFELVGWNSPDEIASYANHERPESRRSVAVAFRYLEFLDDKLPVLLSLISDKDENVRFEALETVKVIANERMLGVLKNIFPESKNPEFRALILDAFGEIGSKEVMPVVLGSTKESNWRVRLSASKALYKLCGNEALKNLEPLLQDQDGSVKVTVNHIFYKETNKSEYLNVLIEMVSGLSKRTRRNAIDALLDIGNDVSIKEVINSFSEQETDIQRHILRRLESSKSSILYQCFLSLFKSSGERIRSDIVEAVKRAGITG